MGELKVAEKKKKVERPPEESCQEGSSFQKVRVEAQGQDGMCRDQSGFPAHSEVATLFEGQNGSVGTGLSCPVSDCKAQGPHVAEVFRDLGVSDPGLVQVRLPSLSLLFLTLRGAAMRKPINWVISQLETVGLTPELQRT